MFNLTSLSTSPKALLPQLTAPAFRGLYEGILKKKGIVIG
jgi:hypothetical protein